MNTSDDYQKRLRAAEQRQAVRAATPGMRLDNPVSRPDQVMLIKKAFRRTVKWSGCAWSASLVIACLIGLNIDWSDVFTSLPFVLLLSSGATFIMLVKVESANSGLASDGTGYWEEQSEEYEDRPDAIPAPTWYQLKPNSELADRNRASYMMAIIAQLMGIFVLVSSLT